MEGGIVSSFVRGLTVPWSRCSFRPLAVGMARQSRTEPIFGQGRSSLLYTPSDSPSRPATLGLSSQPSDSTQALWGALFSQGGCPRTQLQPMVGLSLFVSSCSSGAEPDAVFDAAHVVSLTKGVSTEDGHSEHPCILKQIPQGLPLSWYITVVSSPGVSSTWIDARGREVAGVKEK